MSRSTVPRSIRKFLRREKARIRRGSATRKEAQAAIAKLVATYHVPEVRGKIDAGSSKEGS